ncbi:hypothetical protein [Mesobacterium pallidum]|uniref:hypothetical protein n=1 Tax=Mesobacterium pallidum TaxID=2872037 RepID=UPI001EE1CA26|nr:hypothetical protein [Mesobacterium pallidum]
MTQGILFGQVAAGDILVADSGFGCMVAGEKLVQADAQGGLFVQCGDGRHYLDGQVGEDGCLIGFTGHRRGPKPAPVLPVTPGGRVAA